MELDARDIRNRQSSRVSCGINGAVTNHSIAAARGYLKATLTAIANGHPQSRFDDLLPWNFKPSS